MPGTTTKVAVQLHKGGEDPLLLALNSEPTIRRLGLSHNPTDATFDFMESGNFGQKQCRISTASVLNFHLLLAAANPERDYDKLQDQVGDDIPTLFSVENDQLDAPSPTNPVSGCLLTVMSWTPQGGDINVAREITQDQPVNGEVERLETLPVAPANLGAVATGPAEITLTWDLDTEVLTSFEGALRVTRFDVYRADATGVLLSDYTLLAAGTNQAAAIGSDLVADNVFIDATAPTTDESFYVIIHTDRFGMRSVLSAEVSATTV